MPLFIKIPVRPDQTKNLIIHNDCTRYVNIINGMSTIDQRELRRHGYAGIEPDTVATFLNVCEKLIDERGRICIFDVGANSGMYSIVAKAEFFDSVSIHAFEPAPDTYYWLQQISSVNNLGINTYQFALSDQSGVAEFYISQKSDASNSLEKSFREHKDILTVKTTTLDIFVNEFNLQPDLIKVDAETFDYYVLKGGEQYIKEKRPYIICEVLNTETNDFGRQITALMNDVGDYIYYFINSSGVLERKEFISGDPNLELRDWLLSPKELPDNWQQQNTDWRKSVSTCTARSNIAPVKPNVSLVSKYKKKIKNLFKFISNKLFG
jgi:FkbM family methyltransferase